MDRTITLENVRTASDVTMPTRLKDGGVAIDWTTLTDIKAWLYSDAQRAMAGRCTLSIDESAPDVLVCEYSALKPQYPGVNRLIVQAKYMGRVKTYDKPVLNFVPRTAQVAGEQVVLVDPIVNVEIEVEDVASSILDSILAACVKATEEAREVVDASRGPRGFSAYEIAVQNGFEGTEEEWLASLEGKSAYEIAVELGYEGTEEQWIASLKGVPGTTPHIGNNGHWFIGDTDTNVVAEGQDGNPGITPHIGANNHWFIGETDTGILAEGTNGVTPAISIGTVTTAEPGTPAAATMTGTPEDPVLNLTIPKGVVGDTPNFTVGTVTTGQPGTPVVVTITGTPEAPVLNLTIPQGMQGNTGSSVDYPYELVNNETTDDVTKGHTAAGAKRLKDELSQLESELTFDETRNIQPDDIANFNNTSTTTESPYEVISSTGYRLWYLQVRAGQTITIHHNLASGWIISGKTADVPEVGDAVSDVVRTQYSSTTKKRSFTATEDCYFVFRLASAERNFYVEVPNEGFGADVREAIEEVQEEIDNDVLTKTAQELTDTEQETVRNNIGVDKAIYGSKKNYYEDGRINEGKILYIDGCGTTDFIPYTPGTEIVWKFGGAGASSIRIESFDEDKNFIGYYNSNGYTGTRTISFSNGNPSYIRASFRLDVDGVRNEKPVSIGGVDYVVHDSESGYTGFIESGVLEDERKWKPLPLGGLLNCDTDSGGHLKHSTTYDPLRVTTKSNICVPFPGMRIRHKIPDGLPYILTGYWWVGTSNGNHSTLSGGGAAFVNGGEITLPVTALCIRPVFRAYTTNASSYAAPISAADIQAIIDNGTLAIEYYDERDENVVERNEATHINLQALRRVQIPGGGALNGMDSMPVFAHITDLHGDAPRWKNLLEYCDKFGVDFIMETGDAVLYQKRDASQFIFDFADGHNTDVIACIGNHESLPTGSSTLFADNLSDLATKYEYLASSGTTTTKCYFYKDYDAKKVRVIVLNQHEDGVYARRIGQTQVDWFIATLLSTPAGYGIVIAYHAPEDKVVAESPYDVFRQPEPNSGATYEANGAYVDKRVVELLVDAFISRTSVNFTYEDHSATYDGTNDTTTQIVNVVADFSGVDETTEFICYVCGHRHEDWIGYYDHSTNKQLCLCITCGIALYGDSSNPAWANQSDLPRGGVGVSQDAFCVYAIDRLNGNVKVMRVGATVTQMMAKREMMVIPYKD